jgi:hypothetical protein
LANKKEIKKKRSDDMETQSPYAEYHRDPSQEKPFKQTSIKINHCDSCLKSIDSFMNVALVHFFACQHQYHSECALSIFQCQKCNSITPDFENLVQPSAPLHELEDNDETEINSNRPFAPLIKEKPIRNPDKKISKSLAKFIKERFPNTTAVNYRNAAFLKENGIVIGYLLEYEIDITLDDIYHVFGIMDWSSLLTLKFSLDHLWKNNSAFPIEKLVDYYQVDYFTLKFDFKNELAKRKMTMLDFLAHNRFTVHELIQLGLTFETMINEGLAKRHLCSWNIIPFSSWQKSMGATKDHFLKNLSLNQQDIFDIGWDPLQFSTHFELNHKEYALFTIKRESQIKEIKKNKKKK